MSEGTYKRQVSQKECGQDRGYNFIKLINDYLELHPHLSISVTSRLYKLAVNQFNFNVKTSITRPIDPLDGTKDFIQETGEFTSTPEQRQGLEPFYPGIITPWPGIPISGFNTFTISYSADPCLDLGLPGSAGYFKCEESDPYDYLATGTGIDWTSFFHMTENQMTGTTWGISGSTILTQQSTEANNGIGISNRWYDPFNLGIVPTGVPGLPVIPTNWGDEVWENWTPNEITDPVDDVFNSVTDPIDDVFGSIGF